MSLNLLPLTTTTPGDPSGGLMSMVLPMALIFGVFYFMMIRPQKKREKKTQEMRNKLEVGDEIVTIGGIVGSLSGLNNSLWHCPCSKLVDLVAVHEHALFKR